MIYSKVSDLIGSTPLFNLGKYNNSSIFAKLEMFNPGSSVKDRAAFSIIQSAIDSGVLKEGGTIFEGTSGNTGIALAMVGTSLGFKVVIVMPESMSVERRKLITAFGAKLVLTPASEGMKGALEKTEELASRTENSIIASQFSNQANPKAHYMGTAVEIEKDMAELGGVDIFVSAFGTAGTLIGNAKYLKEKNPNVRIIGIEPSASPLVTEGKAGPHKIQGIGANFIPDILVTSHVDEFITISNEEAFKYTKILAKKFGLLVGISSGAAYAGSIEIAKRFPNKKIVTIFPDTGQRYLSVENLFE